ncbi:MAG TPA: triose-phosphate isomerase [Spirochaetaceae bacterium]|nr:triose-phosphate isomerase [Spirochaetaceae bacterium]
MKRYFIAGNWKMHKTVAEAVSLASELKNSLSDCQEKLMIAPPFTALQAVSGIIRYTNILLGAQNMGPEESGAHTGEVSVLMLKDLGVSVVILGHSERRHTYGEGDKLINAKVRLALKHGLEVILCVGETLAEREQGALETVIRRQLVEGLKGVEPSALTGVTIAYEPVWAIGTGKTATPEDADTVHAFCRTIVAELYGQEAARRMPIQYGGSVKPENVATLMAKQNIDGALVGGASLKAESFVPIAKFR